MDKVWGKGWVWVLLFFYIFLKLFCIFLAQNCELCEVHQEPSDQVHVARSTAKEAGAG